MRVASLVLLAVLLTSPATTTLASSAQPLPSLAGRSCELVELNPGYPWYRGNVTGLNGIGDVQCLEDLEDIDRSFDRDDEDDANLRAARSLGLSGGPELWTWENWMSIEAERGMTPSCYLCLVEPSVANTDFRNSIVERDDPRILAGGFDSTLVWGTLRDSTGYGAGADPLEDYFFRSVAGAANPGRHLNAQELVDAYEEIYLNLFTPGQWLDNEVLWCNSIGQGGYAPTPSNSSAPDQYWLMYVSMVSFTSASTSGVPPLYADMIEASGFYNIPDIWYSAFTSGQTNLTLAEYFVAYGGSAGSLSDC